MRKSLMLFFVEGTTRQNLRTLAKRRGTGVGAVIDALVAREAEQLVPDAVEKLDKARRVAERFTRSDARRATQQLKPLAQMNREDEAYLNGKEE